MDSNVIGGRHEEEQAGKNKCYYCSCSADFGMQYQCPGTAGKNCCYQLGAGGKRHPQYAKLEQGEKILQDLLNKRKGQEELAKRS